MQKNLFYLVVEVSVSVAPTKTDLFGRSKRNYALSLLRKVDFFFVMFYFPGNSTVLQIFSLKAGVYFANRIVNIYIYSKRFRSQRRGNISKSPSQPTAFGF